MKFLLINDNIAKYFWANNKRKAFEQGHYIITIDNDNSKNINLKLTGISTTYSNNLASPSSSGGASSSSSELSVWCVLSLESSWNFKISLSFGILFSFSSAYYWNK